MDVVKRSSAREKHERIMKYEGVLFKPEWETLGENHRKQLREAQAAASKTNNASAIVPAELECYCAHVNALILSKAASISEAHSAFHTPCDRAADEELQAFAKTITAARTSSFLGEARLRAQRTGQPTHSQLDGVPMRLSREMHQAILEGQRVLSRQAMNLSAQTAKLPPKPSFLVDTCIFNWLVEGKIKVEDLPLGGRFIVAHVQLDEINKTADEEKRAQLLLKFAELGCSLEPTESFVWDISRFDHSKWGHGEIFSCVLSELNSLNGAKKNNPHDALIAEQAITNGHTLITADNDLKKAANIHGAVVMFFSSQKRRG